MRSSLVALFSFAAALVSAQTQNYTSELDMTIDPGSVTQQDRATWCQGQTNTCDLLCGNDINENGCTESDLKWDCKCASNNSAPGLQYYTQTVPTFICNELFKQCIATNTGNLDGQKSCTDNIQSLCGTLDPPKSAIGADESSTTATTATATATESGSSSSATGDSVTSTSSDGLAAPTMVPAGKGAAALAIGILAYLV